MNETRPNLVRLRDFVRRVTDLADDHGGNEAAMLDGVEGYLRQLIGHDDWLPAFCAEPHPEHYQQYLLHCDPQERFSVVSFVWGPDQATPVHDHTVWGLIGMLRGGEVEQRFRSVDGALEQGETVALWPGDVGRVSPRIGDVHKVSNAHDDRVSVSIHVYGGNIGRIRRRVYSLEAATPQDFVSGYASSMIPNIWGGD